MDKQQETQIKKWIKQIQKKSDRQAAEEVISFFYREIYAYVYKQTMTKELALDLTQEVFLNMLQSIESYDYKKASFRTWLYKIATNCVVNHYRSRSYHYYRMTGELDDEYQVESDFTIQIENKIELEKINFFINEMDGHRQQIFRLKVFGEYSFVEIAKILKIPESTVKTNFYAVIKLIRKNFKAGE